MDTLLVPYFDHRSGSLLALYLVECYLVVPVEGGGYLSKSTIARNSHGVTDLASRVVHTDNFDLQSDCSCTGKVAGLSTCNEG